MARPCTSAADGHSAYLCEAALAACDPLVFIGSCLLGKWGLLDPPKPIAEAFLGHTICIPWKVSLMDFTVAQAETQLVFFTPTDGFVSSF